MSQPDAVNISSYNAPENQRASEFEAVLANTIIYPKKLAITKFVMPNWVYSFSRFYNKVGLTVRNTGTSTNTSITSTLDSGLTWSSGASFATYLSSKLNADLSSNGVTVAPISASFNVNTGKLTINSAAPYIFGLNPWDNPDPITSASAIYKMGFTNTLGTVGYVNPSSVNPALMVSTLTGDSNLNLLGTSVIYIACSILGNAQNDKKAIDGTVIGDESIVCTIPVNANFGELIIYQDSFGQFTDTNVSSIRTIRIALLDEEYNILTLPRGCYVNMEIKFQY